MLNELDPIRAREAHIEIDAFHIHRNIPIQSTQMLHTQSMLKPDQIRYLHFEFKREF